jgi:hypothetical protein
MRRPWAFVVTDWRYLYLLAALVLAGGLYAAYHTRDAMHFARAGNFVVCIGVWMTMRYTLREGINKHKDASLSQPTIQGYFNWRYFNEVTLSIGEAWLQIYGFALVVVGSAAWAYGDWILKHLTPAAFD